MYCKFCNTEVEDAQENGAYCPNCIEWIETKNISETKLPINKYIVRVPFYGQSRGDKIFHVEATSDESAVHKVKNYRAGDLISEEIVRDDRTEEREYAECYGLVDNHLEPEDKDWWKNKDNFPCILTAGSDCKMMALVNYCIDGVAYDVRDNKYRLIDHTNWRRATKQEIMDNIKGV